jgi:hypothetical protein
MTELRERKQVVTRPPVIRPPVTRKPWVPWLMGFGVLIAVVAIGFAVANLFIGDEEVEVYDRAAEHGDHTAFLQDLRTPEDLAFKYVGQDANLDPDEPFEHRAHTPLIVDLRTPEDLAYKYVGGYAELDPPYEAEIAATGEAVGPPATEPVPDSEGLNVGTGVRSPPGEINRADLKWFGDLAADPADLKFLNEGSLYRLTS